MDDLNIIRMKDFIYKYYYNILIIFIQKSNK